MSSIKPCLHNSKTVPQFQQFRVQRISLPKRCLTTTRNVAEETTGKVSKETPQAKKGVKFTHYESNSWSLAFNKTGVQFLNDPWLVDDLYFSGAEWLFRSKKRVIGKTKLVDLNYFNKNMDFILLCQALDDHTHRPTLKALDKSLLVIAQPDAAAVAKDLGYTNVIPLDHGEQVEICDGKLTVKATVGALVGPPWSKRQNGFVLQENVEGGARVYYEPHCDFVASSVASVSPVDIVISPVVTQYLINFPLVMGYQNIFSLLDVTKPKKL
eukprot:TRINITY_DN18538_c1_g1_i1.p1 TRINITY_DN18538_c1_g1~~TRINITY_DN18538_c1_g1_i1.p1  ORF type:complete len:285 (-),score=18.44 TRINITY_DN18538_c1_g1_i1:532-1338(-)